MPYRVPFEPSDEVGEMLHLQRTIGNRGVQWIAAARASAQPTGRHIARQPEPKRAPPAPPGSKLAGALLGTNRNKMEVRVKREVGATKGYDDRLQASAVARLAKAEPAAVARGADKKWHAFETTTEFELGRVSDAQTRAGKFTEVHGLSSLTGMNQSIQEVSRLEGELAAIKALEKKWRDDADFRNAYRGNESSFLKTIETQKNQVTQSLAPAYEARSRAILGIPESDISRTISLSGRQAGKVNIVGTPGQGSPGGSHNPLGGDTGFVEGLASAISIDFPEFHKDAARVQTVLFHEAQHLSDWEFAQQCIADYRRDTKRLWVKGEPGRQPFEAWLKEQVKKKLLTKADVELVLMQTADASAYTEARANVRTFLAALQAGAPDVAKSALVGYAHALKPKRDGGGGQYASPAHGSEVVAALVAELKAAYGQMSEDMRRQYDDAVRAAVAEFPGAWISALDFSKRPGK